MAWKSFYWSLIPCVLLAGCQRVDEPVVGRYRATIELPSAEVPFHLDIARESNTFALYLVNGDERTRIPQVVANDGELIASFPISRNRIHVRTLRKGLKGSITLLAQNDQLRDYALEATLGDSYRFFADSSSDNADIEGRWQITITSDDGSLQGAVGVFEQAHDRVTGTITMREGSHHIEGQVRDDEVRLSCYAGDAPHLYVLRVKGGELIGEYRRGVAGARKVHAKRNPEAQLGADEVLNAHLLRGMATS